MKYYISHIQNTDEHLALFPLDEDGNHAMPYRLVAAHSHVMVQTGTYTDDDDNEYPLLTRSTTDRQSVALIASVEPLTPVVGQTLYEVGELETVKLNHPALDYSLLGQAWVNSQLIP